MGRAACLDGPGKCRPSGVRTPDRRYTDYATPAPRHATPRHATKCGIKDVLTRIFSKTFAAEKRLSQEGADFNGSCILCDAATVRPAQYTNCIEINTHRNKIRVTTPRIKPQHISNKFHQILMCNTQHSENFHHAFILCTA